MHCNKNKSQNFNINITMYTIKEFMNDLKNKTSKEIYQLTIFLSKTENFIDINEFSEFIKILRPCNIKILLRSNFDFCIDQSSANIMLINEHYKWYERRQYYNYKTAEYFDLQSFGYDPIIHNKVKNKIFPEECTIKLFQINKLYLKDVEISYEMQKQIVNIQPALIKYIKNLDKSLAIYSIKRHFKLIYYINNIDSDIFMEFLKSHNNPHKIEKIYKWAKWHTQNNLKTQRSEFDILGFVREYEKHCMSLT